MPNPSEQTPLQEWTAICKSAMEGCPPEFFSRLIEVTFAGQRLITRARIEAQIDGVKDLVLKKANSV